MQEINSHKSTKMRLGVAGAALCASFLLSTNLDNHTVKADTITGNEETKQETKQAQRPDIPVQVVGGEETNSTNDVTANHDAKQTSANQNAGKTTDAILNQADQASKTGQDGVNATNEKVDKVDTNAVTDNPSQPTIVKNGNRATKSKLTGRKIKTKKDTSDATWDNVQADYDMDNHSLTIKGGKLFNPNPIYKQFTNSEKDLQTIKITGKVDASGSIAKLFANLANVTTIEGLNNINVNSVTDMNYLFDGDKSLTSLDLTSWKPENTTDMNHMFSNCTNLETVYLTKNTSDENGTPLFNTRKVTNMSAMFKNNKKLYYIGEPNNLNKDCDVQFNFACDNVTDMSQMFQGCSSIKTIMFYADANLNQVKNMSSMLADCASLERIYGNIEATSVADLSYFAANDPNLLSFGVIMDQKYGATPHDVTASHMFYNDYQLNEVYPWYLYNLVDASYMFANNKSLDYSLQTFLNELGGASNGTSYISKLTNMAHMLDGCTSLSQLDLTLFNTNDNLKANKDGMFRNLTNLKQITLGKGVNLDGTGFMPPFEYTAVADGTVSKPNGKTYTATGLRKFWNKQTGTETFVGTPAKYYNVTVNYVDAKTKKILKTTTKVGNSKDPIEFGKEFKDTLATLTEKGVYTYDSKNSTVPLDKNDDIQLPDTINSDVTYEVVLIPRAETTGNSDTIVTNVIVHYHDEFGNKLLPDETITGKLGGSWNAVPKEIKGYHLIRTDGMATGTISDVRQEVTFVYAKDNVQVPPTDSQPVPEPDPNNANKPNKPNQKPHKPAIIDHGTVYLPNKDDNDNDVVGRPTIVKAAYASEKGKDVSDPSVANLPQTGVNVKQNQGALAVGLGAVLLAILGFFGFKRQKEEK